MIYCWQLCLTVLTVFYMTHANEAVRIGIVGGGIGGTSAAYFLSQLFPDDVTIELFEKNRIGGRLDVADIGGQRYESGGSIIHPKNKYMMDFISKFGLKTKDDVDGTFGLYDGQKMVFISSSWSLVTTAKLFWRYGYDVYRLRRHIESTLQKFVRIYDLLDEGASYDTVEDLVMSMDPSMLKLTELPLAQYLKLNGYSQLFIDELVSSITLTNYGQRPNMHAFVGMVGLAGAGADLTSVSGGNYQVAVQALATSGATKHMETVQTVKREDGSFVIGSLDKDGVRQTRVYDIVVIATPQTADQVDNIEWTGLPLAPSFPGKYHNLSVTFVDGELRPAGFASTSLPDDILVTTDCTEFNSIGSLHPVSASSQPSGVHKLFSNAPLSDDQLTHLFTTRRQQQRLGWLAYPDYRSMQSLGNFTLMNNLYYLNSIEWAASAMEMSAIAARNVANMAYTRWFNTPPPSSRVINHMEL